MRRAKSFGLTILALGLAAYLAPCAIAQASKAASAPKQTKAAKKAEAAPAAEKTASAAAAAVQRRDPFDPLVTRGKPGGQQAVDPGIPGPGGLVISTLRVDGVVRATNGMIAVIANPQGRVYFLREGARLYDGAIERISLDGVTFRQRGKDPFGKVVETVVRKPIYPRAGE